MKSTSYWGERISENSLHPKKLWNSMKTVLGRGSPSRVSTTSHSPDDFLNLFKNKTDNVARSNQAAPRTVNNKTASLVLRHSYT